MIPLARLRCPVQVVRRGSVPNVPVDLVAVVGQQIGRHRFPKEARFASALGHRLDPCLQAHRAGDTEGSARTEVNAVARAIQAEGEAIGLFYPCGAMDLCIVSLAAGIMSDIPLALVEVPLGQQALRNRGPRGR